MQLSTARFVCVIGMTVSLWSFTGCDPQKLDSYFEGPTKLSGENAAIGGVHYESEASSGKSSWDLHISTCRLAQMQSGVTSIRFGSSSNNLPLSVTRDSADKLSFVLMAPGGAVSANEGSGCTIKLALNANNQRTASGSQKVDGQIRVACKIPGKDINASARFHSCGE